jgi:hypothetical protein
MTQPSKLTPCVALVTSSVPIAGTAPFSRALVTKRRLSAGRGGDAQARGSSSGVLIPLPLSNARSRPAALERLPATLCDPGARLLTPPASFSARCNRRRCPCPRSSVPASPAAAFAMDELARKINGIDWNKLQKQARKVQASTASAMKDLVVRLLRPPPDFPCLRACGA